jgi:hypothetical protein
MKTEIERLKQLTVVYSEVHVALNELASEIRELDKMRKGLSEVLDKTRDEEKQIINKLEKKFGKSLNPDDLLEIIKTHEQGLIL